MSRKKRRPEDRSGASDFFDLAAMDPELLNSHRIPDPEREHSAVFRGLAKTLTAAESRLRAPGRPELRKAFNFGWLVVMLIGAFLIFGPVVNKPLDIDDVLDSAELSEVDWVARDAAIDYSIKRARDGSFVAQVTERFSAHFVNGPEPRVNRTIVTEFNGRDVDLKFVRAEIDGEPAEASTVASATTTALRLTRSDGTPMDGTQDVVVAYELHHLVSPDTDEATDLPIDRFAWPLFAPTWPQATDGIRVTLTLTHEVNDALIRQPQGSLGWLLLHESVWLSVDGETADGVRYAFENDQILPPNSDVWLRADFAPGTFELPPKTPLFWVQTYGPILPLVLLIVLLLCALAARRVVWADSAGDPWFVPRSEPPGRCDPELAAQLRGKARHAELVKTLTGVPRSAQRKESPPARAAVRSWHQELARAGARAGRLGNLPSVWTTNNRWRAGDRVVDAGLRWVPDSYVRDMLMRAPVAIMLVQWGLLRQLSEQVVLSVVWWPVAFVVLSTTLAVAVLAVVHRPQPLTPAGARLVQYLRGIDIYAAATRILDRGPLTEPLLSYAVLGVPPKRAGRAVAELAAREENDPQLSRGWRTAHFVSAQAVMALAAAVAILGTSIFVASTMPPPYAFQRDRIVAGGNLPGTSLTQVEGFDIEAELDRDRHGRAALQVTERHTVRFSTGSKVAQFAQEWPSSRLGQNLGLAVSAVRIDGNDVPFRMVAQPGTQAVITQLQEALQGLHEVEIRYELGSAAVDFSSEAERTQQIRWSALYADWDDSYYTDPAKPFDGKSAMSPLRLQFAVAEELAPQMRSGGWIDSESDGDRVPFEHGNSFMPWESEFRYFDDAADGTQYGTIGATATRADGATVMTLDFAGLDEGLDKYDVGLNNDLGVLVDFVPGTFAGVDEGAYEQYQRAEVLPYGAMLGLAVLVSGASVGALIFVRTSRRRASTSHATISYLALPIMALAQAVLFAWTVMAMPGDDGRGTTAIILGTIMVIAVAGQALVTARSRKA